MKKRSLGVLFVLVVVLVLSFAVVASASAAPYLTSCSPTSGSNSTWSSYQLKIFGQNLSDFYGDIDVALYQRNAPYDTIYATDPYVVSMFGGDYISCDINTYGESAGGYDVEVSGYYLLGQQWPTTLTLSNAFTVTGTSPVTAPTIASISPSTAAAGSGGFQMTVYGSNFGTGVGATSTVYWNDQALSTSAGSTNILTAQVPAAYVANPGKATITVRTATSTFPPTSTTSNSEVFTVTALVPTLTSVSPTSGFAKYYQPYQLTLAGTNFQSTSQVLINGVVHAATYVSSTQITVQLTANDIAAPQVLNISVRNGAGQQPTNTVAFTLQADTTTPTTTITGADTDWHNQPVVLQVSVTDAGGPGVQATYYGIGVPPAIALVGTSITVPAGSGAPQGPQLVQVYSVDKCGNTEAPAKSATVNICTTGPETSCIAPASVKKGKTLKIKYECDSITPQCTAQMKIYKSNGSVAKSFNLGTQTSNKTYTKSFTCNLAPGNYKVKIFATDSAGNAQSQQDNDAFTVTK
jgi:hypothetical protein